MLIRLLPLVALVCLSSCQPPEPIDTQPLNIVLITADDMNWDSVGCNGAKIAGITPHIDQLAAEGILFREAHATIAVCLPVRATMHTGLYPARNGARGFEPIREEVSTINEVFHQAGYLISMLAKTPHYRPLEKFKVDYLVHAKELDVGRNPEKFAEHTRTFLAMAAEQGRPFFHHVNCQDPHRPFFWSGEKGSEGRFPPASRMIQPEEVEVPAFLEDLPAVRQEVADYYTCVHRLDECVGAVMKELKAAGRDKDTLVIFFGGDHGMAFPFAKANTYANSSKATLILRWPGVIPPGLIDETHMVATIDMAPTLLEAAGLPPLQDIDGRSFLPIARGNAREGWDQVITMFHETHGKNKLEMRCLRTREAAYIWNAWSDGEHTYRAENMAGKTWKAMLKAAETDPEMKARCDFYLKRVPQEYYRLNGDPVERKNLINDPACAQDIQSKQQQLEAWLTEIHDPLLGQFQEFIRN
jgi:N-sulfoglucosamine sulfohydrolase